MRASKLWTLGIVAAVVVGLGAQTYTWSKLDNTSTRPAVGSSPWQTGGLRFAQAENDHGNLTPEVANQVVHNLSPAGLEELLTAIGMPFAKAESEGAPAYSLVIGFQACFVVMSDRVGTSNNYNGLQFFATFEPANAPSLTAINAWNKDRRFVRAWLDNESTAALAYDLDLERGITKGTIQQAAWIYGAQLSRFVEYLQPRTAG